MGVTVHSQSSEHVTVLVGQLDVLLHHLEYSTIRRADVCALTPYARYVRVVVARISDGEVIVLARYDVEVAVGDYQASVAAVVVLEHRNSLVVGCIRRKNISRIVRRRNESYAVSVGLSVAVIVDVVHQFSCSVADTIEEFRLLLVHHRLESLVDAAELQCNILGSCLITCLVRTERLVLQHVQLGCLSVEAKVVNTVVGTPCILTHIVKHNAEVGVVVGSSRLLKHLLTVNLIPLTVFVCLCISLKVA